MRIATSVALAALAFLVALAVAGAPPAAAQFAPICDQYPTLPQCQAQSADVAFGDSPPDGDQPPGLIAVPGSPGTAGASAGKLPFTGYPLTPLLLLLLLLLLAGLTIRAYLAIRDRLHERQSGPPTGAA